jgi:ubiquinone/menaquinone biosynthesis C-methylase UbiE
VQEIAHSFHDGAGYEQFMGRWSRALGQRFLRWVAPPADARWLDVGCGTGIFTELILDRCSPAAVFAVDPAKAQIEHALSQPVGQRAEFWLADAQALPFPDTSFDVVASALVMNFITDRPRALSEMRRVTRTGGVIAACVWDFAAELSPSWPLRLAMSRIGATVPQMPGARDSSLAALASLFANGGLDAIAGTCIDVTVAFADFDEFWRAQTPRYAPTTKILDALTKSDHARLMEVIRVELPAFPDGRIEYSARANAIKACARD